MDAAQPAQAEFNFVGAVPTSVNTAMPRAIWEGTGEIPAGAATFKTPDGGVRGRDYVRHRVMRALALLSRVYTAEERKRTVAETVDSDMWLLRRNGLLVSEIVRDVKDYLVDNAG